MSHVCLTKTLKTVARGITVAPRQLSAVLRASVSSRARNFLVDRRRQLPEGFVWESGVSAGFAIRFSCEGTRRGGDARLDSEMMGKNIWCRATSFPSSKRERMGDERRTSRTIDTKWSEKDKKLTRDKRAWPCTSGKRDGEFSSRVGYTRGTGVCKPRNIRTYAPTSNPRHIPVDWYLGPIFISSFARGEKHDTEKGWGREREGREKEWERERNRTKIWAGYIRQTCLT